MQLILQIICLFGYISIVNCQCHPFSWYCDDGRCIDPAHQCNGLTDCPDGTDETTQTCIAVVCPKSTMFKCAYGACVPKTAVCDGKMDCSDGSDEMTAQCPSALYKKLTKSDKCKEHEFQCDEDKRCINNNLICNGKDDCSDGSDELVEICAAVSCEEPAFFRCGYGGCVSGSVKCDGKYDCVDVSDEDEALCNVTKVEETKSPNQRVEPIASTDTCRLMKIPVKGDAYYISDSDTTPLIHGEWVENFASIKYKCNPNHLLIGSDSNTCINGQWTSQTPACKVYCDANEINGVTIVPQCFSSISNQLVSCDRPAQPGTRAIINCAWGYERPEIYQQVVVCGENGQWNAMAHRCTQVCGEEPKEVVPYIVGGFRINITEVSWHVGIYKKLKLSDVFEHICGGTIINAKIVVSAMHCFWDSTRGKPFPVSEFSVAAGKFRREYNAKENLKAQFFSVEAIHYENSYRHVNGFYAFDIVLVVLHSHIEFNTYIRPICIPYVSNSDDARVEVNSVGRVAGWGLEESGGEPSPFLKVIELPVISRATCNNFSTPEFRPYITNDKFCAGHFTGVSVCQGDSGGGLVFTEIIDGKRKSYLRGIVSTGANKAGSCDNDKVATFTSVPYYLDFISTYEKMYQPK